MQTAFVVTAVVLAGVFMLALGASLPRSRFQDRLKRAAIAIASAQILLYLVRSVIFGPEILLYAAIWTFNLAMAYVGLRLMRTARSYR